MMITVLVSLFLIFRYVLALRVLMITVDNRALRSNNHHHHYVASYPTLSAVLNSDYAKKHGYDYKYVHATLDPRGNSTVAETLDLIFEKYNFTKYEVGEALLLKNKDTKHSISSFHVGQRSFRAAAWSKLLAIWHLLQQEDIKRHYDYLFCLDSDTVLVGSRSIEDFLRENNSTDKVEYGLLPTQADIVVSGILISFSRYVAHANANKNIYLISCND